MVTKNKDEWVNVRIPSDMKQRIQELVDADEYENMADLIREAISEKIDPSKRKGITDEVIREKIRQALREDPSILDERLESIGLKLFLQKQSRQ